jgi:hypothetical protein
MRDLGTRGTEEEPQLRRVRTEIDKVIILTRVSSTTEHSLEILFLNSFVNVTPMAKPRTTFVNREIDF